MLQKEFFDRTKITVTAEEYNAIDAMYNNCGNMDKDQFCADYVKHHKSQILDTFYNQSCQRADRIKMLQDQLSDLEMFLVEQAEENKSLAIRNKAIQLMGTKKYLQARLSKGYDLWEEDKKDMLDLLDTMR